MAYFHSPFSSQEETFYRAVSSNLTLQLITQHKNQSIDMTLFGLKDIYNNMHIVNKHIAKRILGIIQEEASVNAVVLLDLFTASIPLAFDSHLKSLEILYEQFLESPNNEYQKAKQNME